jgi:hypothetical protein
LNTIKREAKKIIYPNYNEEKPLKHDAPDDPVLENHASETDAPVKKNQKSFFDEIN